jgi:hypothetical protein
VAGDGAADGGSHDPRRVEPPVVATQESIPGKAPKAAVCEKSASRSGDNGFAGLLEGRSGADDPLGETIVLGWTQMAVSFYPAERQKVNSG